MIPLFEIRAHGLTIYQFAFLASEQVYFLLSPRFAETDIFPDIFMQQQLLLLAVWQLSY